MLEEGNLEAEEVGRSMASSGDADRNREKGMGAGILL
jgi:hypothetical protein